MVMSKATTVSDYLAELPPDRRKTISTVRAVVRKNLPKGYKESIGYGMICYTVPLSIYPQTYNCQPLCYAALAAQKNYCALYLMNVYGDVPTAKAFKEGFRKAGKKLDMGKSCVRFKTADDLPLDVIGKTIASTPMKAFIGMFEKARKKQK
jgi:uncharacterized protein YdhG (YjbR/CyaY superfamily)